MNNFYIGIDGIIILMLLVISLVTFLTWSVLSKILCKVNLPKQSKCPHTEESRKRIKFYSFFVVQSITTLLIVFAAVFNHANHFREDYIKKIFIDGNNTVQLDCYFINQTTNIVSSDKVTISFSVNAYKNGRAYKMHETFFFDEPVYVRKDDVKFIEEENGIRIVIDTDGKTLKNIKLYYTDMEDSKNAI